MFRTNARWFTRGLGAAIALTGLACVAPRAMTQTGRVAANGEIRGGVDWFGNIPTATPTYLATGVKNTIDNLADKSDNTYEDGFNDASRAAVAYGLDPVSMGYAFWARYGVVERVDAGYKFAAGAHTLDARYQFLGAPGSADKETGAAEWYGAVGLQYSQQSFELPSFMDKIGKLFGFEMSRKDLLVPITFSYPFGGEEKYGAVAFGVVGGYTFLSYGLKPYGLVDAATGNQVPKVDRSQGFATYGGFFNVKGGYKWIYLGLGCAAYYQDYGKFDILEKASFNLKGVTIIPTATIEGRY